MQFANKISGANIRRHNSGKKILPLRPDPHDRRNGRRKRSSSIRKPRVLFNRSSSALEARTDPTGDKQAE
ncbi:hypothetical protein G9C98_000328 [Cotesia typhae]|uniref:Uncharacterized protein n=1 Tax=Cotesia typhae TaxID=2053667 RepID=A0A8J5QR26_9HYME|nr:hypothetical protein G9C98_000328 [Cotesia typhae]